MHRNTGMPKIPAMEEGLLTEEKKVVVFLEVIPSSHFSVGFIVKLQPLSSNSMKQNKSKWHQKESAGCHWKTKKNWIFLYKWPLEIFSVCCYENEVEFISLV